MAGRNARDYSGASALPDIHSGQRACPFPCWLHETRATPDSSHVHHTTVRRWSAPSSAPAASPRLRRGPSPWPPAERYCSGSEFPTGQRRTVRTATQPISARFELVGRLRSVTAGFSRTPFRLACRTRTVWQYPHVPALSGLLSTLPGVSQVRLPPASPGCHDSRAVQVFHLHSVMVRSTRGALPALPPVGFPEPPPEPGVHR
jgi:hypothetical protein